MRYPAKIVNVLLVATLLAFASGCASTRMDHLSTTNWMDRHIVPDNTAGQWIMTPVLIPVTVTTLAIDNFIIAPVVSIPSALGDAGNWMTHSVGGYYTEMGVLPLRTLLCPVVFVASELGRTIFAIEPSKDSAWGWPEWGRSWVRNSDGKLLGPPDKFDPVTKQPVKSEAK